MSPRRTSSSSPAAAAAAATNRSVVGLTEADLDLTRRDERALAMRIAGRPMSEIANRFGWTPAAAHEAVERALTRVATTRNPEGIAYQRALTEQRLDALLAGIWDTATDPTGHPVIQQGAVKTALGIVDRQVALQGTNAPRETIVHHSVGAEQVSAVLNRLFAAQSGVVEAEVIPAIGGAETPSVIESEVVSDSDAESEDS